MLIRFPVRLLSPSRDTRLLSVNAGPCFVFPGDRIAGTLHILMMQPAPGHRAPSAVFLGSVLNEPSENNTSC